MTMRTPDDVFSDFEMRRQGILSALTVETERFVTACDPDRENLCLYGNPDGSWEVDLPAEEVPPEMPEPAVSPPAPLRFVLLAGPWADPWLRRPQPACPPNELLATLTARVWCITAGDQFREGRDAGEVPARGLFMLRGFTLTRGLPCLGECQCAVFGSVARCLASPRARGLTSRALLPRSGRTGCRW